MKRVILHYGEIALKNKNRFLFEQALQKRIQGICMKIAPCRVHRLEGRLLLDFAATPDVEALTNSLSKICGLSNFIFCDVADPSLEKLKQGIEMHLQDIVFSSFAVRAKRAQKTFPLSSQFINEEIGGFVKEKTGARVDLETPEATLYIELFEDKIFYGFNKVKGVGGLPVGIAGKVMGLLSGGIDSPVACFRMMKRGCEMMFIHFYSAPFTSPQSLDKVLELAEALGEYQDGGRMISIPFGEIQKEIIAKTPENYRVLVYRRMMLRIAEKMAKEHGCLALATGESLSQVASQTLSNLTSIEQAVTMPVLRPLIGMDKTEIIDEARKIGTFNTSIQPHEDCCSFMIPKHPKTKSTCEELERIEKDLEIDALVQKGVKECKVFDL
ncbi:MAG: tRNA uracil 4-sulfurtransferase ThiI [Deltaproteobacteria bacterium]|nr:tRNA uracil 4-sulfurtransferase ThiI [Deltaproteobacteria bacterium]